MKKLEIQRKNSVFGKMNYLVEFPLLNAGMSKNWFKTKHEAEQFVKRCYNFDYEKFVIAK